MTKDFDYKKQPEEFYQEKLSSEVYNICRKRGTERATTGEYDKFYESGTYYCAGCGGDHPLYSSETKYNSGSGWPSFWQPYNTNSVELKPDERVSSSRGMVIEVLCARCGSHLGHVFEDGPKDKTGQRYCINSLALNFVPEGEQPTRSFDPDDQKK